MKAIYYVLKAKLVKSVQTILIAIVFCDTIYDYLSL